MKKINLHEPYQPQNFPPCVLLLGFFDGVHLGHQALLEQGRKLAKEKGIPLAILTFSRHPSMIFKKQSPFQYLLPQAEKEEVFAEWGVDLLYCVEFTSRFANLSAEDFVKKYILGLQARAVVVGFDYHYGAQKAASALDLKMALDAICPVTIVPCFEQGGKKVSSTRIRNALRQGKMEEVQACLGHAYTMKGYVVRGDARGRTLGFPTANLNMPVDQLLPMDGIYIVEVAWEGKKYQGMASIGHNVTFGAHARSIEVHILDFNEEIYGETLAISWLHYLRAEEQFDSVRELIHQLQEDEKNTRQYFAQRK